MGALGWLVVAPGAPPRSGYRPVMRKLIRLAALFGIAKKVYQEAQRPENQARLRAAADKIRQRQAARR
ncbi:hypothetical protein ASC77_12280 [Nocardioides sp. Root1257]|nr:hypothetical protein ASC77_12280 [Nocardioides sp. Root1257]KRC45413.1 hypothetical protein ASE24_12285 [Nocardioides sp. Root224]